MMPPLPATVSLLEIAWTLAAIVGVCIAIVNCVDANGDLRVLRESGRNGAIKVAAEGELSDQRIILLALVCKFLMGLVAMTSLPGRAPSGDLSWATIFIPVLMITVALALIYLSITKKWRRQKIGGYLRMEQDQTVMRLTEETHQRHVELTASLDALHHEVADNTAVTEHAAERADAAYREANHVNAKIEATNEAGKVATEAGNNLMGALGVTGKDTNERVKRVEAATVDATDALVNHSGETNKRLDKLEESADESFNADS
jgi:hypothetical protein